MTTLANYFLLHVGRCNVILQMLNLCLYMLQFKSESPLFFGGEIFLHTLNTCCTDLIGKHLIRLDCYANIAYTAYLGCCLNGDHVLKARINLFGRFLLILPGKSDLFAYFRGVRRWLTLAWRSGKPAYRSYL